MQVISWLAEDLLASRDGTNSSTINQTVDTSQYSLSSHLVLHAFD
jgi:hypothetical protein